MNSIVPQRGHRVTRRFPLMRAHWWAKGNPWQLHWWAKGNPWQLVCWLVRRRVKVSMTCFILWKRSFLWGSAISLCLDLLGLLIQHSFKLLDRDVIGEVFGRYPTLSLHLDPRKIHSLLVLPLSWVWQPLPFAQWRLGTRSLRLLWLQSRTGYY